MLCNPFNSESRKVYVVSYASVSGFPATGSIDTIYIDDSTNEIYRWTGSAYVVIGEYPSVPTYADLPPAALNNGKVYLVTTSTGIWPFSHPAGFYISNGVTWTQIPATAGAITYADLYAVAPITYDGAGTYSTSIATNKLVGRYSALTGVMQEISLDASTLSLSGAGVLTAIAAAPSGAAGGDLTGTYPNPTIANLAVTNAKIANSTIDLTAKVTGILPNANTTATSANTASAIIARDINGDFTARKANLTTLYASADANIVGYTTLGTFGAVTIDQRLTLRGTASNIAGPHWAAYTTSDIYPVFQQLNWSHDNINLSFDAYYDSSSWRSSDLGSNYQFTKFGDRLLFNYAAGIAPGSPVAWNAAGYIDIITGTLIWNKQGKFNDATDSSSIATGGLTTLGGLGVTKSVYIGGNLNVAGLTASRLVYSDASKNLASVTLGAGLSLSTGTLSVNTSQNITKLSNLTTNGFVKTSGGDGTLSVDTSTYALDSAVVHNTGNETIAGIKTFSSFPPIPLTNIIYVSTNGSDSNGNGSDTAPYLTIAQALTSITTASYINPFAISLALGTYLQSSLVLKPNVSIIGNGSIVAALFGSMAITLDSGFNSVASYSFIRDINCTSTTNFTYDLTSKFSLNTTLLLDNINRGLTAPFNITGTALAASPLNSPNYLVMRNCFNTIFKGTITADTTTLTNMYAIINNCTFVNFTCENTSSSALNPTTCDIISSKFTALTLKASGSQTLTSTISGISKMPATWTIDGANSIVQMYSPFDIAPTLANSATFSPTSLFSGIVKTSATTASTSTTTGAIVSAGGLGVAGAAYIGGNINCAGTLTLTPLTLGSIPFVGTGGLISQSNSKLFWDNTNNRLGIGTVTPSFAIEAVAGAGIAATLAGAAASQKQMVMAYDATNNVGTLTAIHQGTAFKPIWMQCDSMWIQNGTTPGTPVGGYYIYGLSGALKGKGTSATVTNIGNADPHCKKCGSDFGNGWENPRYGGEMLVCKICETEYLDNLRKCISYIANDNAPALADMQDFLSEDISHVVWNVERNDQYKNIRIPQEIGSQMADDIAAIEAAENAAKLAQASN